MQIRSDLSFVIRESLIDFNFMTKRIRLNVLNPILIPVLVPMFLILSSSVYPAIMSSMENKEMLIISEVIAQLEGYIILIQVDYHSTCHT